MAIAFDAATDGSFGASPLTFAHTCTGSDLALFVMCSTNDGVTPTATYNGVAMTRIASATTTGGRDSHLFILVNPATGANNVVITASAGNVFGGASSYTGAKQSGQPNAFVVNEDAAATSLTGTVNVTQTNCWLVCLGQVDDGSANISGGSGTTERVRYGGFNQFSILDSNGTVGTGNQSLIIDSNTVAAPMQIVVAALLATDSATLGGSSRRRMMTGIGS